MSAKTASQLTTDANLYVADNSQREISASDVRQRLIDIIDSALNIKDGGLVVQALAGYSSVFTPTDQKHFVPKKYVDDQRSVWISDTAYDATSWNGVTDVAPSKNAIRDQIESIIASIPSIASLWAYNGNTVGSEKWIGTVDNFDLPIRINNVEQAKFRSGIFELYGKQIIGSNTWTGFNESQAVISKDTIYEVIQILADTTETYGLTYRYNTTLDAFQIYSDFYSGTTEPSLLFGVFSYSDRQLILDVSGSISIFAPTPNFQGGESVLFIGNNTTDPSTDPTGGVIKYIKSGTVWYRTPTGENVCVVGKYVSQPGNYTIQIGEVTVDYTGTGGHTFTMHSAVGYKENKITAINSGTGNLTMNSTTIVPGDSLTIVSDGSNWKNI